MRRWEEKGCVERVYEKIYAIGRKAAGKEERATVGIVDSQLIKTTEKGVLYGSQQTSSRMKGVGQPQLFVPPTSLRLI